MSEHSTEPCRGVEPSVRGSPLDNLEKRIEHETKFQYEASLHDMTEQEAWELDELLTKTTPEISPDVEGPFIKHRNMMVILDQLSAQYLTAKMLATKQSPTEIISNMVRRELSLAEIAHQ